MEAKIPLAFAAGLISFATPCVLPLVPGYLAVVSGQPVGQGGRRVLLASLPFIAGFTAVFVALGAAVAAAGSLFGENRELLLAVAGLIVVVLGFAMMGLLPLPFLDRLVAPGLVEGARSTGSAALLGAAFGLCAAPVHRPGPRRHPRPRRRGPDGRAGDAAAAGLLRRARAPVPARRHRLRPRPGRVPLAPRPLPGVPGGRGRDAGRARAPALLRPLLVAERGGEPRLRVLRARRLTSPSRKPGAAPAAAGRGSGPAPPRPRRAEPPRRARGGPGRTGPSRRSAFSSWRSQPTSFPRPAWYHATATWTRPW